MVVTRRRGGGHVGLVSGFTPAGDSVVFQGITARGRRGRLSALAYVRP
jgi:hypothetical protein